MAQHYMAGIVLGIQPHRWQCEEQYVHMCTLCIGKLYKIKEINKSYTKWARSAQAEKLVNLNPILIETYFSK